MELLFRPTHYAVAWIAIGSLVVHIAVKLPIIRSAFAHDIETHELDRESVDPQPHGLTRRGLVRTAWIGAGVAVLASAGQTLPLLRRVSVFGVRSGGGPQGTPINKTAAYTRVTERARSADYRLTIANGKREVTLGVDDLTALARHTESLPMSCVEGWSAGGTWRGVRVRDLLAMVDAPSDANIKMLGSASFLLMPIIISPTLYPSLVLTPVLFAIGYAVSMVLYLRDLRPATERVRAAFGGLNAGLAEAVEGIETIKGAAEEQSEVAHFEENARGVRDAFVEQGRIEARFLPLLLLGLAQGAAFGHTLWLFQQGAITIGSVVAYMGLIALFGFPVFVSLFAYSQLSSGLSSARRILELINAETEFGENLTGHAGAMQGAVRFENVTFRYSTAPGSDAVADYPSLQDVSLEIQPGQTLALVGQTGSGKSTAAKLINRIYDVESGSVSVDGVDVRAWNLAALRRQISIIEQDIFLYRRTIAENIAFGKPDATQHEIEDAAQAAQAHDFIVSFPDGYQTTVGERGVSLSGGQRQRIALARAFLTDPAVLILDDSTSAIDSATEDQIQQAIQAASRGRTTILITHRLSQIRWADKIVVLRSGRVVAIGAHDELLARSEAYRDIFARL